MHLFVAGRTSSMAVAGFFERRIDARYRTHEHMLLMTLNDDEYCLHRMHGTPELPVTGADP